MPGPADITNASRFLFSGIAGSYDRPAQILSYLQYRRWHRFLLSHVQLSPPARILDMATGTGALALELAQRPGIEVVGSDITRPMLLQAQTRGTQDRRHPTNGLVE